MSNRDDFTAATKLKLAQGVGYFCSNPDCKVLTVAARTGVEDGILNMGRAAHITAAAPGGKRYDDTLTPIQRRDITNGIWLCVPCSEIIDKDDLKYPVKKLLAWKNMAISRARLLVETRQSSMLDHATDNVRLRMEQTARIRCFIDFIHNTFYSEGDESPMLPEDIYDVDYRTFAEVSNVRRHLTWYMQNVRCYDVDLVKCQDEIMVIILILSDFYNNHYSRYKPMIDSYRLQPDTPCGFSEPLLTEIKGLKAHVGRIMELIAYLEKYTEHRTHDPVPYFLPNDVS